MVWMEWTSVTQEGKVVMHHAMEVKGGCSLTQTATLVGMVGLEEQLSRGATLRTSAEPRCIKSENNSYMFSPPIPSSAAATPSRPTAPCTGTAPGAVPAGAVSATGRVPSTSIASSAELPAEHDCGGAACTVEASEPPEGVLTVVGGGGSEKSGIDSNGTSGREIEGVRLGVPPPSSLRFCLWVRATCPPSRKGAMSRR